MAGTGQGETRALVLLLRGGPLPEGRSHGATALTGDGHLQAHLPGLDDAPLLSILNQSVRQPVLHAAKVEGSGRGSVGCMSHESWLEWERKHGKHRPGACGKTRGAGHLPFGATVGSCYCVAGGGMGRSPCACLPAQRLEALQLGRYGGAILGGNLLQEDQRGLACKQTRNVMQSARQQHSRRARHSVPRLARPPAAPCPNRLPRSPTRSAPLETMSALKSALKPAFRAGSLIFSWLFRLSSTEATAI